MKFKYLNKRTYGTGLLAGMIFLAGSWGLPVSAMAQGTGTENASNAIGTVSFDPAHPCTGDSLRAVVQAGSADPGRLGYKWKVNGQTVQNGTEDTLTHPLKRGDFVELDVIRSDGAIRSSSLFVANAPPNIRLKGQQIDGNGIYTAQLEAEDPEADPITLTLKSGPQGMEIEQSSKTVRWKVPADANGNYGIEISARDPQGDETLLSYQVKIGWETGGKANGNATSSNSPKQ